MSNAKYEYMWKFLQKYNYNEADNVSDDVKCVICTRILVNPCIAYCGCRYCLSCVTEYLNDGSKFCPGNTEDCKVEFLDLSRLVRLDVAINLKISKLILKCPRELCQFRGELRKMQEHERVCESQAVKCPYSNIGCQQNQLIDDAINVHLVEANESHAKLLMECIGMLQNENEALKREFAKLRDDREGQQRMVEQQVVELHNLKEDNRSIKENNNSLKSDVEIFRMEYSRFAAATKLKLSEKQLPKKHVENKENTPLVQPIASASVVLGVQKRKAANTKESRRSIGENRKKLAKFDSGAMLLWQAEINNLKGQFVWLVEEWADKMRSANNGIYRWTYSGAFWSHENGYRMCMSMCPRSDYLYIYWNLMSGPFDNKLAWPFKGTMTVSIINQDTRLGHVSETLISDTWMKPSSTGNFASIRSGGLMDLGVLSRNAALCRGDRIFIRCVVELTP